MKPVIESAAESGDGLSFAREKTSTAFRSMPHYTTYGSTLFSAQPADELTGTFNALNETTNFKPSPVSYTHLTLPTIE